jgi:hypothetical protein
VCDDETMKKILEMRSIVTFVCAFLLAVSEFNVNEVSKKSFGLGLGHL